MCFPPFLSTITSITSVKTLKYGSIWLSGLLNGEKQQTYFHIGDDQFIICNKLNINTKRQWKLLTSRSREAEVFTFFEMNGESLLNDLVKTNVELVEYTRA